MSPSKILSRKLNNVLRRKTILVLILNLLRSCIDRSHEFNILIKKKRDSRCFFEGHLFLPYLFRHQSYRHIYLRLHQFLFGFYKDKINEMNTHSQNACQWHLKPPKGCSVRAFFNYVSNWLTWFCIAKPCDWSRKLAPPPQSIRCRIKTQSRLDHARFPALQSSSWFSPKAH